MDMAANIMKIKKDELCHNFLHHLSWEADTEAKFSPFETELNVLHSLSKDLLCFANWAFEVEGIQSSRS